MTILCLLRTSWRYHCNHHSNASLVSGKCFNDTEEWCCSVCCVWVINTAKQFLQSFSLHRICVGLELCKNQAAQSTLQKGTFNYCIDVHICLLPVKEECKRNIRLSSEISGSHQKYWAGLKQSIWKTVGFDRLW